MPQAPGIAQSWLPTSFLQNWAIGRIHAGGRALTASMAIPDLPEWKLVQILILRVKPAGDHFPVRAF